MDHRLDGGIGADEIVLGVARHAVTGGPGPDLFRCAGPKTLTGRDEVTILDFEPGQDRFLILGYAYDFTRMAPASRWISGRAATP
jgi:Ca2+-binding RTX toxin-like protein